MSATVFLPPDVATYLERVRGALADLPAEERDELLADVEASLLEAAADSVEPLEQRLGPATRFATELRAAAGLEVPPSPAVDRLAQLRTLAASLGPRARELAPIWWLARAYVAVSAINLLAGNEWSDVHPAVPDISGPGITMMILLAAAVASIWLGLRRRGVSGRPIAALNAALAIAAVPVGMHVVGSEQSFAVMYPPPEPPTRELTYLDGPVENIYPYSRDGRLLFDVLLYDQFGRPLEIGAVNPGMDPFRRRVRSTAGDELRNAFPIRYVEPGTQRVAKPEAGPPVDVPRIRTPPLRKRR